MDDRPAGCRPVGTITRGTTGPNRLRRCDRWLVGPQAWRLRRAGPGPVVVDLGYGGSPVTARELHDRLRRVRPDVQVVGIEIDPARVASAQGVQRDGLRFRLGGFEVPLEGGARASLVRAFNVLRQYDEADVAGAWAQLQDRLTDDGLLVDGTCDEVGRRASWVAVDRSGALSLTFSLRLRGLARPSDVAERLPKALIHHNVPGERVHAYLRALDRAWAHAAPQGSFGVRQRFISTVRAVSADWPLLDGPQRWRLGEVTVAWPAVAPGPSPYRSSSPARA
ncbi:class I SAM-dependent methyltransferase [Intrasporangium sp.]|uniref:class I SAM-dependent methyltransferase n=1 Tax=Intrasporangium sp. TaxID=1925024 RepID=UPI0032217CBE